MRLRLHHKRDEEYLVTFIWETPFPHPLEFSEGIWLIHWCRREVTRSVEKENGRKISGERGWVRERRETKGMWYLRRQGDMGGEERVGGRWGEGGGGGGGEGERFCILTSWVYKWWARRYVSLVLFCCWCRCLFCFVFNSFAKIKLKWGTLHCKKYVILVGQQTNRNGWK